MSLRVFSYLFLPLFLALSCPAQAQLYKWVGPDGKINYGDSPPKSASRVEERTTSSTINAPTLPYELAQAVKNMPVTFYSADKCPACVDGKKFLKSNGIPFTEKIVSSNIDIDKLSQLSGGAQVPVLKIGKQVLSGFNSMDWRTRLTQAGYPENSQLPANYSFSAPQPLTETPPPTQPANPASGQQEPPARDTNGFRF